MMALRLLTLLLLVARSLPGAEVLTSIEAIRRLPVEEAHAHPPVRLEAVALFYHPDWGVLFVHDGTSGICVGVPADRRPERPYAKGMRLSITGFASEGEFLPVVLPESIQPTGEGTLPAYQQVGAEDLLKPGMDCHPVEVDAVVKGTSFMDQSLVVDLQVEGWLVRALLPQRESLTRLPWQLLERRVKVRGVAGTHFNDQRQMSGRLLFVHDLDAFQLVEEARTAAQSAVVPVNGLLRVDSPLRVRVRVRGQATHVVEGRGLYLRDAGGSMFVQTAQPVSIQRGDEVEAEGFPVVTPFRPSLSAVDVKKLADGARPVPVEFHAAAQRNSAEQCELVTLAAEFMEMNRGREATTLICRAEGHTFEALLGHPAAPAEEYEPGTKLQLTGICELVTDRALVIPRNATGFRILLREPGDIAVTARPSWWNERHALWVLGGVGALALLIAAWAVTLQNNVSRQSKMIRQQAQQHATLEERQRIARDLHDTLEQELVGVNMLLDSTFKKLNGGHSAATETLDLARRLLRRAREDSRSTIRELRSVSLEQRGLPAAMEELLRPLATAAGAEFHATTTGTPARLAGTTETALLRLAQEAVSNAGKHSQAQNIELRLDYDADRVSLEVRDDGRGFDLEAASAEPGHFGLSGMRERAEKLGGQLRIESQPGRGTRVSVSVSLNPTKA
ncbi:MAG: sensor histidine kinase [Verrucomicrobiaceae bacterium]|nr:sensor histidine kinase [Verrucomicrobiaceae bacterium]